MIGEFSNILSFNRLLLKLNRFICNQGPVYTMDHEVGPWKMAFVNGLSSWSNFHGPTT